MIEINYRFLTKLALALIILIISESFVVGAYAEDSYVIVDNETVLVSSILANVSVNETPIRINQGDTVYIGQHVDMSGAIPPYPQIAYWDGYDMYDKAPSYNITMPDYKSMYYDYYIDPDIFLTRLGKWYKYDGTYESRGNNHAFTVALMRKNQTLRFPNGTIINQSFYLQNETINRLINPLPEILPEKHESDYLITTEESFNITVNKTSALWLFNGEDNSILYTVGNSQLVFDTTNISHLQPGTYSILIQSIGNGTQGFDVIFTNNTIRWFNQKTFTINEVDTSSMVPSVAIERLKEIFPLTRDKYVIKRLSVQYPEVIISQMNEMYSISAKTYYRDISRKGNVSVMDVRGYVNTLPHVNITVKLDATNTYIKDAKFTTFNVTPQGDYDGNWRQWRVNIPFYWDALESGRMHSLSAQSILGGGTAYSDFMINEMPSDSYVPSDTVKWVGDRNPWVPTPTPEIVKEITQVTVIQTREIPVAPSNETILEQQRVAYWEGFWSVVNFLGGIIAAVFITAVIAWMIYTHKRVGKEREWWRRQN
jgi:hypothetical protein